MYTEVTMVRIKLILTFLNEVKMYFKEEKVTIKNLTNNPDSKITVKQYINH